MHLNIFHIFWVIFVVLNNGCSDIQQPTETMEDPVSTGHLNFRIRSLIYGYEYQEDINYTIRIFSGQQIPALDSLPYMYTLRASTFFELEEWHLKELLSKTKPSADNNSGSGSIYSFRVYIEDTPVNGEVQSNYGILMNLQYNTKTKTFLNESGSQVDSLTAYLSPIVSYEGWIDVPDPEKQLHFFFISGSPFYSALDMAGRFSIRLPSGKHEGSLLSFHSILAYPAPVFLLNDSLNTDSIQQFSPSRVQDSIYTDTKFIFRKYKYTN